MYKRVLGYIVRSKRSKHDEAGSSKNSIQKCDGKCINKDDAKPPDPPKDYIHARARRGQPIDSHSLAERTSEITTLLQDLASGCKWITGKAVMLDAIINYVQSMQRQVELLTMKMATINPRMEFNRNGAALSTEFAHSKDFHQDTILLPRAFLDYQTRDSSRTMDLLASECRHHAHVQERKNHP
ncbi:hypothetical protein Bca52824_018008 [Brassica carinata]|uniref:BHLH domain-containing protein n=1 Tax=Brassica carinata TaxID=52824 RepID=A0A8X7VP53_BRACI|nr:hypothetical protein Bca52824_018008 [Brassica carinata]